MKLKTTLAVAAVSLFAATGIAQAETSPFYLTLGAGVNYMDDQTFSGAGQSRDLSGSNPYWAIMGAAGIGVFNNFRVELEGSYRAHGLDEASGDIKVPSAMLNVFYDIPVKLGGFTPYIGAGAGASWIKTDNITTTATFGRLDDTDQVWTYQGIIGVAADLAPNWKLTVDYRYLGTFEDPSFTSSNGTKVDGEFSDHTLMVGFRYSFGAPPAPAPVPVAAPAPAPAPAPAEAAPLVRSFLVFFDFNRADITDDARKVINQAADNARKAGGTTRINLTGHADRSGSAQYNLRLSQRRADAVKAELVKLGVPAGDITTVAKGETDPLVPTADGVREPRNRRVEIVF